MKGVMCGIEADSMDEAIDEGWTPYFNEAEKEHGPACPACFKTLMRIGEDGEMQISDEYTGKIIYQPEPLDQEKHLVIGVAVRDESANPLN
ncbi:MAG: hypothetical protein ACYS6K_29765 [Planctomycetota bacterium]|jgi:hypothetical protein